MENSTSPLSRNTVSFGLSLAVVSVINALIVVAKESSKSVMAGMKQLMGHHWVTHSVLVLLLFALIGFAFTRSNGGQGPRITVQFLINTLLGGVLLGGLIIVGFYLIGD
jgi:hypothetical protein